MGYRLDVKTQTKDAQRMSREENQTLIWALPAQVKKDFSGVRGRVKRAVAASPRSVTFSAAVEQVRRFSRGSKIS
jgi:hypothetical protein